jgi:hypothetical protein
VAGVSLDSLSSASGLDAGSDADRNDRVGLKHPIEAALEQSE